MPPQPKKTNADVIVRIAGQNIAPQSCVTVNLNVGKLYTDTPLHMPVRIFTGKKKGPVLFVSGGVHGDEIIGVDVIRRLIKETRISKIKKGALILLPILNVFGFLLNSRYLPDRRDLNRTFPGSPGGSMASRIANIFMNEIVANATHGIDIHAGSFYRENLQQIRAHSEDKETLAMAEAFGAPVILHSDLRDGSLREASTSKGVKMLVYEAGEALRFDENASVTGVNGIIGVMQYLGMIEKSTPQKTKPPFIAKSAVWVRAPRGGVLWDRVKLGSEVTAGQILAYVSDPFGDDPIPVLSPENGLLIGCSNLATANEGDGLFHIATATKTSGKDKSPRQENVEIPQPLVATPDH